MGYMDNFKTSLNQVFRLSPNEEVEDAEMMLLTESMVQTR